MKKFIKEDISAALTLTRKVFSDLDWVEDKDVKTEVQTAQHALRLALEMQRQKENQISSSNE